MVTQKFFFLQPVTAVRSSLNRRFIYALLLPLKITEGKLVPYFIGDTTQLVKRLANHKEVNWYLNKYKEPVPVLVLGTTASVDAFEARQDLAQVLYQSNVLLVPHNVSWVPRVKKIEANEFPDYVSRVPDLDSLLPAWRARWEAKTQAPVSEPTKPVNVPVLALRKQQLIDYCEAMNFATETERRLVLNIAYEFSDYEGSSKYVMSNFECLWLNKTKKTKIQKIFTYPKNIEPGTVTFFYPQQSVVNKIIKPTLT